MEKSFIKKITSVLEFEKLIDDISDLYNKSDMCHIFNMRYDFNLIKKSLAHESLLLWNIHVWGNFNGDKWDGIFIGIIRKSEKFNKKIMEEYIWFSQNSTKGINLLNEAIDFAKKNKCDLITLSIMESFASKDKLKLVYEKLGFVKDLESYCKLL